MAIPLSVSQSSVEITQENGGDNALMELWNGFEKLEALLHVKILSDDGWSWLLAWKQFGIKEVERYAGTPMAHEQLKCILPALPANLKVKISTQRSSSTVAPAIVKNVICTHFSSSCCLVSVNELATELSDFVDIQGGGCLISVTGTGATQRKIQEALGTNFSWQNLRHSSLGGLTKARLLVGWAGFGGNIHPGKVKHPARPLGRFLEPATRLSSWRMAKENLNDCWYPNTTTATPYPWPWRTAPTFVQTSSVFFKFEIQRKFTDKELCQLMDLSINLSSLVGDIWLWNDGSAPPLRMLVEFIISLQSFLQGGGNEDQVKRGDKEAIKVHPDWGRQRAPWLGQTREHGISVQLERLLYFGWVWDPKDAMDIAVACKGDDATVDLKLWAVGGEGEQLEEARATIRNWLWGLWLHNICKEALNWVNIQCDTRDRFKNLEAMNDCLQRCHESDWWNYDWFYKAQQAGDYELNHSTTTWVWDLPPAAAIHALEELGAARLKRHDIVRGVVIIPQLLTYEWFRRFSRTVDVYFVIPPGSIPEWPTNMHESLTIGLYLPLFRYQPWDWKQVPFMVPFGGAMSALHKTACQRVWCPKCYKANPGTDFLIYHPKDDNGEELLAPGEEKDFLEGRAGDHLFCPFECDVCSFYRIRGHVPVAGDRTDDMLMTFIRRANLDAFWSRRPGTVYNLNSLFGEQVDVGENFGFQMFEAPGPFGATYDSGLKAAIGILWRSRRPGLHEATMKYSSVRKARSLNTDLYHASARGIEGTMVWRSDRSRFVSTKAPTDSAWFNRFMIGFKARVGERRKQDAALSIDIMLGFQQTLEEDWDEAIANDDQFEQRRIAEHAAFYLFLYCGSLRGFEGSKVVLNDLRRQIVRPGSPLAVSSGPYIALSLAGRFKARSQHADTILIHVAYETASSLKPGLWAERLIQILETKQITSGWVFQDENGEQVKMSHFEDDFYDRLARLQQQSPGLFTESINISEDFHIARSFRRGATTRATAAGVSSEDIDYLNRWNIGTESGGSVPMRVLYSDRTQLIDAFLRFSLAL